MIDCTTVFDAAGRVDDVRENCCVFTVAVGYMMMAIAQAIIIDIRLIAKIIRFMLFVLFVYKKIIFHVLPTNVIVIRMYFSCTIHA